MGFGPTPSSIFGMPVGGYSSMSSSFGAASSSSNSDMLEKMKTLESELEAERERRNTLESELEAERERRSAFEGVLLSTFQDMFGRVPQRLANFISHPPPVSNLYFTAISYFLPHLIHAFTVIAAISFHVCKQSQIPLHCET